MSQASTVALPKTGIPGLVENWRSDLLSGFLVFLIALPLCLGIAMASGFPPMAGIISAIIGGVVVSRINGSYMTINGPAAGLIVVIVDAVQSLGQGDAMAGYRYTLAAIVVASVLQVLLGVFKAGKLSAFFPSSVVHGMLAAIGIIIMAKQIHTLLGVKPEAKTLLGTIAEIPHSIVEMNPEVSLIGLCGLALLILWSVIKQPTLKMIPAPLLVVMLGLALGQFFDLDHIHQYLFLPDAEILPHHEFTVGPAFLVAVPENFMSGFYFPDFSKIADHEFWISVVTIWLVGSLESLLSASAVDKLDPYKRNSNLNRDLAAVGVGNLVSGMIGGLPMIAEIVRSSANINNGAKTGWANFFHGLFLLIFVALFPRLIHEIPLTSLAALLVFTGFRLASPKEFAKTLTVGLDNFAVFVITIIGVIATDLLVGVAIGIVVELLIHVSRGLKPGNIFSMAYHVNQTNADTYHIAVSGAAVFSNFISLKSLLADFPEKQNVFFDLTDVDLIDHTVMEFIHHYTEEYNHAGGRCQILGLDDHHSYSDHHLAARRKLSV
ncbi:SulP family inorganic anion transporter [Methylomonas sp. MED-D]|uniref:SulP family inorganic anion transporter n=1 Tax=unclassified Methylomonas TaxID=2608980 RepID=UPI0008DAE88C|nr:MULTISPECIES: SulP family inorganic anion transporter [unclassified Methylomonas]MDT4331001.1 SulP family inorganic anion transporter [Methylomonas sp. MV1]OHX34110.1 sulfate transporter [Methylomonas sp. LWB]